MASSSLWQRFQRYFLEYRELGFSLDISRMKFPDDLFEKMRPQIEHAFAAMRELETGAIANPTENRMVGHYWLRNPPLAPTPEIRAEIEDTIRRVNAFAKDVHAGKITAENGTRFKHVLHIGIGGSALGPQFVSAALDSPADPMDIFFFDNTDPEGFDRVFDRIGEGLPQTLVIVVSKSGGTKETRNGMLEAEAKFAAKGLQFARHAVAVTGVGSELDKHAEANGWLARFPMPDWIGGRTSVMSAVGLLPMALQGFDIDAFLAGAAAMDERTRVPDAAQNAAMLLALMWYYAGNGKGEKDMVVLPYKDRLALFTKYLQQLVMESLGKEFDLLGAGNHFVRNLIPFGLRDPAFVNARRVDDFARFGIVRGFRFRLSFGLNLGLGLRGTAPPSLDGPSLRIEGLIARLSSYGHTAVPCATPLVPT
jgi:glucose-6-phosphate isomerase